MKLKDFKESVHRWADKARIPKESSEADQVRHGLSEFDEAIEAYKLNDFESLKMELGDIVTFSINAARFPGMNIHDEPLSSSGVIGRFHYDIYMIKDQFQLGMYNCVIAGVKEICGYTGLDFEECLELTWDKIKNRKLCMFDGKAVKYESMTDEQKRIYENQN